MKISYDTSTLGIGYINPKAKTGVYRIVESLFLELLTIQALEVTAVTFHQGSSIYDDISTKFYFQKNYPNLERHLRVSHYSNLHLYFFYRVGVRWQRLLMQTLASNQEFFYRLGQIIQLAFNSLARLDGYTNFQPGECNLYHSSYFALPSSILGIIPRILTIYDLIPVLFPELVTSKKQRQFRAILNSIDRDQDWIICPSNQTRQDLCNYLDMKPERVFVVAGAVANHFYQINDSQLIATTLKCYSIPDAPYLLSLSTLEPRKNLDFLIRCFYKIINDDPSLDLNLVLVGVKGWKHQEIFTVVEENIKLQERIIFTGYIPDADLNAIYSGAIAFIYPSLYEGFGLPPLEAMKCGTPVVVSNNSSLPEVVEDAGILVNPKQEDELCEAMLQIINNSKLREQLSQRSIQQASKFSWAKCAQETVEVYKTVLSNSSS